MWIESVKPLRVQFKQREVRLQPGQPVELPDDDGRKLVNQAGDKVRIVQAPETIVEPAAVNARPVYWEDSGGKLCGPAVPEFLAKTGTGDRERFWIVVMYQGSIRWIWSDRLRTAPTRLNEKPV